MSLGDRYLRLSVFEGNHHAIPVKFRVQVRGVDSTQTTLVPIVIPSVLCGFERKRDGWRIIRRVNKEERVDCRKVSGSEMVTVVRDESVLLCSGHLEIHWILPWIVLVDIVCWPGDALGDGKHPNRLLFHKQLAHPGFEDPSSIGGCGWAGPESIVEITEVGGPGTKALLPEQREHIS
jgi:hypothetical protein